MIKLIFSDRDRDNKEGILLVEKHKDDICSYCLIDDIETLEEKSNETGICKNCIVQLYSLKDKIK